MLTITVYNTKVPGDPKKSMPLFGVSGGTQVFAKQLNRHIFGFATKNLTISDQYFLRFPFQKKDICNSAVGLNTVRNSQIFRWESKNMSI